MKTHELFEQTGTRYGLEFSLRSSELSHEELLDVTEQLIHEGGGKLDWHKKHRVKKPDGTFAYNMLTIEAYYPLDLVYRGKANIMKKARRMSRSPRAPWYLMEIRLIEVKTRADGRISKFAGELEFGPEVRQ